MLVSSNNLLNILLPNDNKVLKQALKQADSKALQEMIKNKSFSTNEILKNLFDDIKSGSKTNLNIENILKNSNISKEFGSFSKSLENILKQLDDPKLEKFKPALQNFFKNIKNLDENSLKEQLNKSGVFLESKIASNNKASLPANLEKLLNQVQNILKDTNSPASKQINDLIGRLISSNNTKQTNESSIKNEQNLKSLVSLLQNISSSLSNKQSQGLQNLTSQLKTLMGEASLIESKEQNTSKSNLVDLNELKNLQKNIQNQTKQLLGQIKNEVLNTRNMKSIDDILPQVDRLINTNNLFEKNEKQIEPKNLLNNLLNSNEIKQASKQNHNISNLVLNLKNISENINELEVKTQNFQNIKSEKTNILQDLKQNLNSLKNELLNIKNIDTKNINQIISKLENIQNIFTKVETPINSLENINTQTKLSFPNNFTNNLNSLLLSLKENIVNLSQNENNTNQNQASLQNQISNTVEKIETIIKENFSKIQNPFMQKNEQNPLSSDMKTVLLQMQEELSSKSDAKSQELFKQVDKMIMQIDYHQLLSLSSNSNNIYVPFFWDMLEEGSIAMKKTDEEKFFCQINLSLKDYGKVDLMLALYDKNKLDLTIKAQRTHFKEDIKENLQKLKQALNSVNLIPMNIQLLDLKEEETKENTKTQSFINNAYENSLSSSVDIRI